MSVDFDAIPVVENTEMVELFKLNGKAYSIPAKARVNIALRYFRSIRKYGAEAAGGELLEEMLGAEAYTALMEHDALTTEDLNTVIGAVQKVVLGDMEKAGKG